MVDRVKYFSVHGRVKIGNSLQKEIMKVCEVTYFK